MQQAMLYSFVVMMPFALLSGLTTPISSMPAGAPILHAGQSAALRDRHRAGASTSKRRDSNVLIPDLWPLAVIAAVTLTSASWLFRHRLT